MFEYCCKKRDTPYEWANQDIKTIAQWTMLADFVIEHEQALRAELAGAPKCAKCGGRDINKRFHKSKPEWRYDNPECNVGFLKPHQNRNSEHIHCFCRVCGFDWCEDTEEQKAAKAGASMTHDPIKLAEDLEEDASEALNLPNSFPQMKNTAHEIHKTLSKAAAALREMHEDNTRLRAENERINTIFGADVTIEMLEDGLQARQEIASLRAELEEAKALVARHEAALKEVQG